MIEAFTNITHTVKEMSTCVAPIQFTELPREEMEIASALWKIITQTKETEMQYNNFAWHIDEAWETEKSDLPEYLAREVVENCKDKWFQASFVSILTEYMNVAGNEASEQGDATCNEESQLSDATQSQSDNPERCASTSAGSMHKRAL